MEGFSSRPADGSYVQKLSPDDEAGFRHYYFSPVISPGGAQIAYSTSRYVAQVSKTFFGPEYRRQFEIEISNLDGSVFRRLTYTAPVYPDDPYNINIAPTWSPDGRRLTYVRDPFLIYGTNEPGIHSINVDGTASKNIVLFGGNGLQITQVHKAPVWSPNRDRIAFVGRTNSPASVPNPAGTGHHFPEESALYVVSSDGEQQPDPLLSAAELLGFYSVLRGHALSAPAWTQDSNYLAVSVRQTKRVGPEIVPVPEQSGIYIINADGSGKRRVLEDVTGSHLQWSPDGLNLLVSNVMGSPNSSDPKYGTFVVGFDQDWAVTSVRALPLAGPASWSPNGARIAAWDSNVGILVTVAADGTDRRIIAHDVDGPGVSVVPRRSADVGSCSAGVVVPDPQMNPMLVADCENLLRAWDQLGGVAEMPWSLDTSIFEWQGLWVGEMPGINGPARVAGISLSGGREATRAYTLLSPSLFESAQLRGGALPAELAQLTGLVVLQLVNMELVGNIPPEFGALKELREITLSDNRISDEIPSDLAALPNLEVLNLRENALIGGVPFEVSELKSLTTLDVSGNLIHTSSQSDGER